MASYLNVFVAGELETIETEAAGTQIRVIATKGKAKWGQYALESTAQILQYYNDYFGVPYPLPKLDQIAIPGGFGGAMENWGAITYFETALSFSIRRNLPPSTKQRIYEVIAHETAHQWFGDLVTMAWWDNLWLNEGFASWMGTKCTAHFNPQWEVWLEKNIPRDPDAPDRNFQGVGNGRRRQIDHSSDPATGRRTNPTRTMRLTISLIEKARRFCSCSRVFSAKTSFATVSGATSRRTNIRTPPRRICGTR